MKMTVMTDDSFFELEKKRVLVMYYIILIHKYTVFSITVICYPAKAQPNHEGPGS